MTAEQRRQALILWLRERPQHDGLTAPIIASFSGIYTGFRHGRTDRCFDDLKVLADRLVVERSGRPATWHIR